MKRLIIALLILIPFGAHAQGEGFDKLIKKYETRQGIIVVNLEGNILEGLSYFVSQYAQNEEVSEDCSCEAPDEEDEVYEVVECEEACCAEEVEVVEICVEEVVAEAEEEIEEDIEEVAIEIAEYDPDSYKEYEYLYGEEGDYDYDEDDYDFDYSSYYNPYGDVSNYLEMCKTYINSLTYLKAIVYENPHKKFAKDVQREVVSKKPYKCIVSMQDDRNDIRLYMIDDEAEGSCDMLAIVKEGDRYVVANIVGNRDFKSIIDAMKEFL